MTTKPKMTAADARALADRLAAEEKAAAEAERTARRNARLAKARELVNTLLYGELRPAAEKADADASALADAGTLDVVALVNAYAASVIAQDVHDAARNTLNDAITSLGGERIWPGAIYERGPQPIGFVSYLNGAISAASNAAAMRVKTSILDQLTAAENDAARNLTA